ncbi:DNA translocase FtsK 4TM domain-containing protein [Dinoroseobacter sp. PD6]|uniref:DNA translocase FtsK n=1 Tax=Dinoroseobacter sp. PD6 TaxID=3028384 RepID=UPI00237B11CC|nr:DNA translocase FtsK [Dinoroseobacter sp. PD6]MDD9717198.1 DNA translocase FtsK 4TM domain-containing protein [Dinoroseobacter sp. PD6]
MAYHPARQRDPLLDTSTQAALEKRGRELLGLGLLALAAMLGLALASYVPDDPGWMSTSQAPAENWMGRPGATVAAPLNIIIGHGAWALVAILAVWGGRFLLHRGSERFVGRMIFAPIAVACAAVYAATLVPGSDWTHSFGLGGLFGDTVLGALLGVSPLGAAAGLKLASLTLAVGMIALLLYVAGFVRSELTRIGVFLLVGLVNVYEAALAGLGKASSRAMAAGTAGWEARKTRAAEQAGAQDAYKAAAIAAVRRDPVVSGHAPARVLRAEPVLTENTPAHATESHDPAALAAELAPEDALPAKPSLLARVKARALARPSPTAEATAETPEGETQEPDRISAAITDAITRRRNRVTGRALILPKDAPAAEAALPPEPPLRRATIPPMAATLGTAPLAPEEWSPEPQDPPASYMDTDVLDDLDAPFDDASDDDLPPPAPTPQVLDRTAPTFQRPRAPEPKSVVQHPPRKATPPSRAAQAEAQPALQFDPAPAPDYEAPPLSLLTNPISVERLHLSDEALEENARMLESVLDDYGVKGEIVSVRPGPVVTMYELEPAPGLKASRVIGLADDIARSMSALSARVSTVPGRSVIGIELPNAQREKVVLREILAGRDFGDSNLRLPLALGKDIGGEPVVANLAKMPHLLIAGTTGSGKSVAINTMILSLLYKLSPEECRLIMIDPKMLELSVYDGIPHLLSPVVTDPKKAVVALKWVVAEMEERYRKMSKMGVRNIEGYNGRVKDALSKGEMFTRTVQTGFDDETGEPVFETEHSQPVALPYIVVIVDEMADLMMVAGKEIEACIQRLAQMARASGIHLIMATQRPSVDVITGTIKANFPTRISFQVTSKIDSRTILGEMGAEQLLGMGDMLYMAGGSRITRVHGPFVSDEEVEEVVTHLKSFGPPEYMSGVVEGVDEDKEGDIDLVLGLGGNTDGEDALYDQAVAVVIKDRKCSTSYIQRKLAIGYNKAARLVEQMEEEGLVSPANHVGKREILVPEQG